MICTQLIVMHMIVIVSVPLLSIADLPHALTVVYNHYRDLRYVLSLFWLYIILLLRHHIINVCVVLVFHVHNMSITSVSRTFLYIIKRDIQTNHMKKIFLLQQSGAYDTLLNCVQETPSNQSNKQSDKQVLNIAFIIAIRFIMVMHNIYLFPEIRIC